MVRLVKYYSSFENLRGEIAIKRKNQPGKKLAWWYFFLGGLVAGAVIATYLFFILNSDLKDISSQLDDFTPSFTSRVYDSQGELIHEFFTQNREFVELSAVPDNLKKAFIASEDQRFYQHAGIDPVGIGRALLQNLLAGEIVEGASTITQQLSRNQFLSQSVTWDRKIKEIILAFLLEKKYTKEQIFEAYLNQIYFGHGAYGVKTATRIYFGKELDKLNLAECAVLVGVARSPYNFSPYLDFEAAKKQQRRVLNRMETLGFITPEEKEEALNQPLVLSGLEKSPSPTPYFTDFILKQLLGKYDEEMIFGGGLKIYTTLDLNIQKEAQATLEESGYQGAVLCLDPQTGHIKAMVGGRDYQESKFNRATQAYRQPGSTFKPFIYSAALDSGFTPSTILIDEPLVFPNGWKPQNYEKEFRGAVTLREALEHSINIIGIKLLQQVGVERVIQYAQRMGIESPLQNNLSLALGTSEVTLLELVKAYSAFANQGKVPEPIAILKIEDQEGNILFQSETEFKQAISPQTAYIMARLLQGVVERGTGQRAQIGRPTGGKTGTTEDFIDAWFVGFTPDLVTGVFLGNDDRTPLGPSKTGGVVAAPIFAQVMKKAHENLPNRDFSKPEGIVEIPICTKSGLLPGASCSSLLVPFKAGTEPTQVCFQCR
ncbi:MAG: penicillin-binding protein [Candidatus Atribacteria bacterium]|nr:penicillin-binding protein [Candidatus Atribacteria bacterium]